MRRVPYPLPYRDVCHSFMKNTPLSLIIGAGEVGLSLANVLDPYYRLEIVDREPREVSEPVEIMHVCIGYGPDFVSEVNRYQQKYKPEYTVIHSTVPVGTSRQCDAVFSAIVGKHPNLTESLTAFTKFLAGENASLVANYFRRSGMKVYLYDRQETLELAKISQTTFYALMVEYVKDLKRQCDEKNLSFSEVYTLPSLDYNRGYEELGNPEFKMPMLVPIQTKQGGHCTIPNCYLWDTPFTKLIIELNEK